MQHKTLLAIAALSLVVGCSGAPDSEESIDEEIGQTDRSIKGGTAATSYEEAVLVDMKKNGYYASSCSGAMIAPRVVLTAGHCVHGYDGWTVSAPHAGWQQASATSSAVYDWNVNGAFVDPYKHDVGLVFLSKPITLDSYPTLATAAVASGTKVVRVGRIQSGKFSSSSLFVSAPVAVESGSTVGFPYSYASTEIIESGDSGGPVLLPGSPHHIVAVNSGAGGGTEVLARVDLVSKWIQEQIAKNGGSGQPQQPPSDPCGGVTWEGKCEGNTVVWCEASALKSYSCGSRPCGWDTQNQYYDCL